MREEHGTGDVLEHVAGGAAQDPSRKREWP